MQLIFFLFTALAIGSPDDTLFPPFQVVSAASPNIGVAPDSLAAIYGTNLANVTASASLPWPTALGDVNGLTITDSTGVQQMAKLIYVSPGQINLYIPAGLAPGMATVAFVLGPLPPGAGAVATMSAKVNLQRVAPGLFSANGTGGGVAAATAIRITLPIGTQSPFDVFTCTAAGCIADPINVGLDQPVYLTFYGTGIRSASSLSNVVVTIGNMQFQPTYAGPQPQVPGLDQVNVPLSLNLRGSGLVNVTVTVDGVTSNAVQIDIQ